MLDRNYWLQTRLNRRRLIAASGSGLLAAGVVACGGKTTSSGSKTTTGSQASAGTSQPGGILNVAYFAGSGSPPLDPQKVSAVPQLSVAGVYSRLFRFKTGLDPKVSLDHNVENDLGLSAESPDAITWTVKLRPDARFTNTPPVNGHVVEAEDVKTTFTRILDPATSSPNRGQLGMLDPTQIQTPDKNTVVFKLRYPYAPFSRSLASPAYSLILPRETLAGAYDPAKVVIGSGPFTLESATPDVAYVYKKNPDYFDKTMPNVDGIRMAIIPDANTQLAQFTAGNLDDVSLDGPNSLAQAQKTNPKAILVTAPNATPTPIFWQLGDSTSVFQDIRVRQAFNMAVDREALSRVVYNGQAQQPVFVPTFMGKWSMQISDLPADIRQYYTYNPSEAKKLLEAAGATNLQLTYTTIQGPSAGAAYVHAETVNSMINAIGVKTNISVIDYNTYVDAGHGISQGYYPKDMIVWGGFSPYTEADEWLFAYWHSKSVNSHENVKDPKMDAMIDKERTLLDESERVKAVHDMQTYVAQQVWYLPTIGPYAYTLQQPRVKNYQYTSTLGKFTEAYAKLWLSS
jgi:peptide/nickel transport system substrate-binding protein